MRRGQRRGLTEGERALAREVFAGAVDLEPVRLWAAPVTRRIFVPGRAFGRAWIVWPWRAAPDDASAAPLPVQAALIHELVHVWQAQAGVFLPFAKLVAGDGAGAYDHPPAGAAFARLNIEQQAVLVERAFLASRGRPQPWSVAEYRAALPFERA